MKNNRGPVVFSLLLITVGTGWLLSVLNVIPQVNWAWTLGLAAIGGSTFLLSGFDKFSVVVGLFFIAASGLSVLRQTGQIAPNIETPVLVITAGVLTLLAQCRSIRRPDWIVEEAKEPAGEDPARPSA